MGRGWEKWASSMTFFRVCPVIRPVPSLPGLELWKARQQGQIPSPLSPPWPAPSPPGTCDSGVLMGSRPALRHPLPNEQGALCVPTVLYPPAQQPRSLGGTSPELLPLPTQPHPQTVHQESVWILPRHSPARRLDNPLLFSTCSVMPLVGRYPSALCCRRSRLCPALR